MNEESNKLIENILKEMIKEDLVRAIALKMNKELINMSLIGRGRDVRVASIIYLAYRKAKTPKSLSEIASMINIQAMINIQEKEIGRDFKKIVKELGMKYCKKDKASLFGKKCMIQPEPIDYLNNLSEKLKISDKIKAETIKILKKCRKFPELICRNPLSVTCASIYLACFLCNEKRTQRKLANAVGIDGQTLRNSYQMIVAKLDLKLKMSGRRK